MNQRTLNFLELYFEAIEENIEEVEQGLKDSGIKTEETEQKIMQILKQKKTELKIERGKKLKEKVGGIIKQNNEENNLPELDKQLSLAARKLGTLNESEILIIKKNNVILNDIGDLIKKRYNES